MTTADVAVLNHDPTNNSTTTHHQNHQNHPNKTKPPPPPPPPQTEEHHPQLILNPYRWTRMAHLLVIENPVGVGYSYCHRTTTETHHTTTTTLPCLNNDTTTAQRTLQALIDFYTHKLPTSTYYHHHNNNVPPPPPLPPFYLMGESYAGVYIPTLTRAILQYNQQPSPPPPAAGSTTLPLRGIAVGDPCTDTTTQSFYMDPLWYAQQYGLLDEDIYRTIQDRPHCRQYYQRQEEQRRHIDDLQSRTSRYSSSSNNNNNGSEYHDNDDETTWLVDDECRLAYRKYLLSSSRGISAYKNWNLSYIDRYSLYGFVTPDINRRTELFMNHPLVRKALHIPEWVYQSDITSYWKVHSTSDTMIYTKLYQACNQLSPFSLSTSMIDIYRMIIPQLPDGVLIYNGNTDPAISYEGTRTAVKAMGYPEIDGGSYRPWFYHHTNTSIEFLQMKSILFGTDHLVPHDTVGVQLGGYITNYAVALVPSVSTVATRRNGCTGGQLSFVTIHGSGHLVPQNRPQSSYHMISKFLQFWNDGNSTLPLSFLSSMTKERPIVERDSGPITHENREVPLGQCFLPLSPLLPSNASLLAIQNDTALLLQAINHWTRLAKRSEE